MTTGVAEKRGSPIAPILWNLLGNMRVGLSMRSDACSLPGASGDLGSEAPDPDPGATALPPAPRGLLSLSRRPDRQGAGSCCHRPGTSLRVLPVAVSPGRGFRPPPKPSAIRAPAGSGGSPTSHRPPGASSPHVSGQSLSGTA